MVFQTCLMPFQYGSLGLQVFDGREIGVRVTGLEEVSCLFISIDLDLVSLAVCGFVRGIQKFRVRLFTSQI